LDFVEDDEFPFVLAEVEFGVGELGEVGGAFKVKVVGRVVEFETVNEGGCST
jgi:hypothetical protein